MVSYSSLSDDELVAIVPNDATAFNEIYERYWSVLYRAAFNVLKEEEACLDVVQDVFVWFWENRTVLKINSVKAYLLVAVKYKVANYIRNGKVRASFYERIPKVALDEEFPDEVLEIKELKEMIARFIISLPERCREVFELSRNEHLSNKEIALRLGITEKTVENQINKALKQLRKQLGRLSAFIFIY
ncbi:RNA polymerase sigma-70 factor [Pedobacter sp. MC2016-24]|uniref:RNA polymerase sigma-70 factor n=1 Tax=Pedobacter sp. MC2016-24 TaxID=2780090 RepID=UPI00187E45A2|nr:RNA polymerase sigma-70 factor [Pedobacter sp. MC2016-24]MBE9602859.1 RNA polymerase sigma-70 factor [Pedobacter sp. MC2016-24]